MIHDVHPWAAHLESLHAQVWDRLVRGVHDRRAPARHPTLATVSLDGRPRARTVVLRRVDRREGSLDIHTDLNSPKVSELSATPFAALHVWDGAGHLQIRLDAKVTILSGAEVADIWQRVPEASRASYGRLPHPGQPIAGALDYTGHADPAAFGVLRLRAYTIEALHLGTDHRRALYERSNDWKGQWLAP